MRRLVPTFLCVAFALAFVQAPFVHTHEHSDPFGHSGLLHGHIQQQHDGIDDHESHLPDHDGARIHGQDPDQDARMLDSFHFVKSPAQKLLYTVQSSVVIPEPRGTLYFVPLVNARGHDPPYHLRSQPRAPPAYLSHL